MAKPCWFVALVPCAWMCGCSSSNDESTELQTSEDGMFYCSLCEVEMGPVTFPDCNTNTLYVTIRHGLQQEMLVVMVMPHGVQGRWSSQPRRLCIQKTKFKYIHGWMLHFMS
ncbi:uncharacterized protein LOC110879939 [Helianthus annuus]|uniref:uncharacterized protein LOC110879939 n=1 Tax=Helianthus annuus TaxID=4232 RepID=UPI0016531F10|nr:uncharacterized protein LOC110879939 [Helianthus annuus]